MEDIEHCRNSNIENYENFAKQIYDEFKDFDDKILFQVNRSNATETETPVDHITKRKPNPRFHNQDISQTLINDRDNIYLYLKT